MDLKKPIDSLPTLKDQDISDYEENIASMHLANLSGQRESTCYFMFHILVQCENHSPPRSPVFRRNPNIFNSGLPNIPQGNWAKYKTPLLKVRDSFDAIRNTSRRYLSKTGYSVQTKLEFLQYLADNNLLIKKTETIYAFLCSFKFLHLLYDLGMILLLPTGLIVPIILPKIGTVNKSTCDMCMRNLIEDTFYQLPSGLVITICIACKTQHSLQCNDCVKFRNAKSREKIGTVDAKLECIFCPQTGANHQISEDSSKPSHLFQQIFNGVQDNSNPKFSQKRSHNNTEKLEKIYNIDNSEDFNQNSIKKKNFIFNNDSSKSCFKKVGDCPLTQ